MSILHVPELLPFDWLTHGFGTRNSDGWTHGEGRTWAKQIHSANVLVPPAPGFAGEGDALVTNAPGLLLEIRTADCLPVLLVDPNRRAIGAVHAGWRGVAGGIGAATVQRLAVLYGSRPEDLFAAIGPGIGECCFEVGPEVAVQFGHTGRVKIHLASVLEKQLQLAGIAPGKIFATPFCTRCEAEKFFSFRRDREKAGRQSSAIGIRRDA